MPAPSNEAASCKLKFKLLATSLKHCKQKFTIRFSYWLIWGGSPALRFAPGQGQAVQGYASLPCCAPFPSVAPFPSLPQSAELADARRRIVLRGSPPHCAPFADAALRSALLASLLFTLAAAPVATFGRPPLPQTCRTRPAQLHCVGSALLRRLRYVCPALSLLRYGRSFSY